MKHKEQKYKAKQRKTKEKNFLIGSRWLDEKKLNRFFRLKEGIQKKF